MIARPWRGLLRSLGDAAWACLLAPLRRLGGAPARPAAAAQPWERAASRRRRTLLALVALSAGAATYLLAQGLAPAGDDWLRWLQIGLFALLFAWVSAGFFTALMGFLVLCRGDRHALSARSAGKGPIDPRARTAIVMPICNEQVATVFAGLRATWESLAATGVGQLFDVFVLSDSGDPATRTAELAAWARLRLSLGPQCRIYYRWRQRRTKRKAGNVADFCRRWGRDYRYMVVLDADSIMSGEGLVTLVRLMEANERAGIIQTAPQTCGLKTVHARSQQFAARVAGRLFTAGMQFWQLGESHYWGHNAIIRIAPFMQHCALAPLRGRGGLSGEILSHDFVEAALMRRAGYQVWVVQDLAGSYEQQPPNLLEELKRDRRWCQGNLQNARLIAEPGLHGVHRAMLLTGAMAYLSAPLWLAFVLISAGLCSLGGRGATAAFMLPSSVAPLWVATATMLVLPRVLGVLAIGYRREAMLYGGMRKLVPGTLLEAGLSVLQAPVRMIAHTVYVFTALTGLKLEWKSPPREAEDVLWRDAARRFALISGSVAVLAGWILQSQPQAIVWLVPVGLPLLLAIPLAVWTSRSSLGQRLMTQGLLLTPEERMAPAVLQRAWAHAGAAPASPGWREALTDPWLFDVVRAAMGGRDTGWGSRGKARRLLLRGLVAHEDAERLSTSDRMRLLSEPQNLVRLRDQLAANMSAHASLLPRRRADREAAAARACA
jgi:membrane glycosyltransferase